MVTGLGGRHRETWNTVPSLSNTQTVTSELRKHPAHGWLCAWNMSYPGLRAVPTVPVSVTPRDWHTTALRVIQETSSRWVFVEGLQRMTRPARLAVSTDQIKGGKDQGALESAARLCTLWQVTSDASHHDGLQLLWCTQTPLPFHKLFLPQQPEKQGMHSILIIFCLSISFFSKNLLWMSTCKSNGSLPNPT